MNQIMSVIDIWQDAYFIRNKEVTLGHFYKSISLKHRLQINDYFHQTLILFYFYFKPPYKVQVSFTLSPLINILGMGYGHASMIFSLEIINYMRAWFKYEILLS